VFSELHGFTPVLASIPIWDNYVDALERALNLLAKTFHNAGLAVVVFTIVVKTLMLPLTVKSIRSSKAMQELQPKIKELQKKHGKDRQKISQETMRLYSEYHINPAAGCLPMVIQAPIFFGLYRAIRHLSQGTGAIHSSEYWTHSFLWLNSLANADPYKILPIMAGIFQFVQTKMMKPAGQQKITDPQQAMMNTMMNFMPLMVVVFGWRFASGPVIYWVTQSVYSVIQQWFITGWGSLRDWAPALPELPEHRRLGYRPPRSLDDVVVVSGEAAPAKTGVMGWFQRKMEEAQAQQAERAAGGGAREAKPAADSPPAPKGPRPVKKDSPAARAQREMLRDANPDPVIVVTGNNQSPSANGVRPKAVPRKSRPHRPPDES
jgi:YidC/Oxa1 family membrane protein insertase